MAGKVDTSVAVTSLAVVGAVSVVDDVGSYGYVSVDAGSGDSVVDGNYTIGKSALDGYR